MTTSTPVATEKKPVVEKKPLPERIVQAARDVGHTGDHDADAHDALLAGDDGPHHFAVLRAVLARAGVDAPKSLGEFVELAKKNGSFVLATGKGAGTKPEAGDVVAVALGHQTLELSFVVCSISDAHLESYGGGETSIAGGRLAEHRSRQWEVVQPRDENGNPNGLAHIVDSVHHHITERRSSPRIVSGWVSMKKWPASAKAGS